MKYDLPKDGGMFYGYGDDYTVSIHTLRVNSFDFGLESYPIWDESYRDALNLMLLDYFDSYEIGCETPAAWRRLFNAKLSLIMPRYNIMFKARNLTVEPLLDHDEYKSYDETGTLDTKENNSNNRVSKTTTADNQVRDNTALTDKDVDDVNSRDVNLVHAGVETGSVNVIDNETGNESYTDNESKQTHSQTVTHDSHEDFTDEIVRNSDTPQQSIENLGYAPDPAPNPINDPDDPDYPAKDTLFNPSWVDKWLTSASKKDTYQTGIKDGTSTTDGTETGVKTGSKQTTLNKTSSESSRGTDDYTDTTDDDYTGHIDDVTNYTANETIDRDVVQDYSHSDTLDKIVDTDTTKKFNERDYGRHTAQQLLASQLYETAYDIEMLIVKDLEPLFMQLYY